MSSIPFIEARFFNLNDTRSALETRFETYLRRLRGRRSRLCAGCGRILDPALVSGHAVVRNGRIVVAATNETIVLLGAAMRKWLPEGRHICPECIGGYLSVREVTLPVGFSFDEMRNRAVRKGK